MTIDSGEVVGFLGRSGSGKSTFLRLIAGLAQPVSGTLRYLGKPITEPAAGIAMVFQSFALFPWMTVLENVQLGLEALKLPRDEIRKRALGAIDLIGLDGFESAYPRELSGGMRQRVGVARALVMHPNILLMDEPFSALDVLTAETLRTDLMDLWIGGQLPIKSIILVTHNIEEAVLMCDRIMVFSGGPGHIETEIKVDLARPRNRIDAAFQEIVEHIYVEMTGRAGQERPTRHVRPAPGLGVASAAGLHQPAVGISGDAGRRAIWGQGRSARHRVRTAHGDRRPVPHGRDACRCCASRWCPAATSGLRRGHAVRRIVGGRPEAHLRPAANGVGSAGGPYPPGVGRTRTPRGAAQPVQRRAGGLS